MNSEQIIKAAQLVKELAATIESSAEDVLCGLADWSITNKDANSIRDCLLGFPPVVPTGSARRE